MPDLYWPVDVIGRSAYPLAAGYGLEHERPVMTRDWGLSVSQVRYASAGLSRGTVSFSLADNALAYVLGWIRNEAAYGSLYFWAPIKAGGVLQLVEIQIVSSLRESYSGPNHQTLSFDVITRRSMTMDAETYALVQEYEGVDEYVAAMDGFNKFAENLPQPRFAEEDA